MSAELLGGLLIGGQSQRMGRPKQLIELAGRSFAEHGWQALGEVCSRRYLLGTGTLPPRMQQLPQLPDKKSIRGPLAGNCAAFEAYPHSAWLIIACDMPLVDTHALRWLISLRQPTGMAVQTRLENGVLQPLFAVYEPSARIKLETLALKGRGPASLQHETGVRVVDVPKRFRSRLTNINTPDELDALEALIGESVE